MAVRRVMHELKKFAASGPLTDNHIGVSNDPDMDGARADDLYSLCAFIVGPEDSPYSGGFFSFSVRIPPTYPSMPPTVNITTTNDGKTRFNPNLYAGGKVCMDILNNHASNAWNAGMGIETILLSTQSLMKVDPYHNEPGFEDCAAGISPDGKLIKNPGAPCVPYAAKITHEVLRHAVCDVLEQQERRIPKLWREVAWKRFQRDVDGHIATCDRMGPLWNGKQFEVARFEGQGNAAEGRFDFTAIRKRLVALKAKVAASETPAEAPEQQVVPKPPQPSAEPAPSAAGAVTPPAFVFSGPPVGDIDDRITAAMVELGSVSAAGRDSYEMLMAAIAFCLMDEPIIEPIVTTLPPAAAALAKSLGYEPVRLAEGDGWALVASKANRDAFEVTQALLNDAMEQ
jgi:ubiquitin-protein ligase